MALLTLALDGAKRYMALLTLALDAAEWSASRPDRLTLEEVRTPGTQLIEDWVGPNNHIKDVTVYYKDEWKHLLKGCQLLLLLLFYYFIMSLVTGLFFLVILLNQQ